MSDHVIEITAHNFSTEVIGSDRPVLVDFWASWCGPCLAIAPHVEALAEEFSQAIKVGKLNVDEQPQLASQFGIRSIPTLILFKGGKPLDQLVGSASKAKMAEMIKKHI